MSDLKLALEKFVEQYNFKGKGPLSVALQLTRVFKGDIFPLNPEQYVTEGGGQVKGLGGPNLKAILLKHNITKTLASEAGRTSRNSLTNMRSYVSALNSWYKQGLEIDWDEIESFWIDKVHQFFASKPFKLNLDPSRSIRSIVQHLMDQTVERQKKMPGTRYQGIMMQHLVGAKLEVILGKEKVRHNSATTSDQDKGRTGDFDIEDSSIHITTNPTEALIDKCRINLESCLKPVIITIGRGAEMAEGLAENANLNTRIDVLDFIQFITANIYEHANFDSKNRFAKFSDLIDRYNEIIEQYETDPSLRIEIMSR